MGKIRVLLADDHAIVREGVRMLLNAQPDVEVVGEAANGEQTIDLTRQLAPDIVLMDIGMPGMNGLQATRAVKAAQPQTNVLVLTMQEGQDYFFSILAAGASGYVLKGAHSAELLAAIRAVHKGGVYLDPMMAKKLMSDYLKRGEQEKVSGLSDRERQVLRLIADGLTAQQIADKLVISVNTVQTHRLHIMEKLNLHNRAELIKYAIHKGLIQSNTP
jgi:two-component system response regulator NreC